MLGFFLSLLLIIGIQWGLSFLLQYLNVPTTYIELVIDLVLGFVFAVFNYRKDRKNMFKDPSFHRDFAIYFAILVILSLIFGAFR